jgi:hypothetical protein
MGRRRTVDRWALRRAARHRHLGCYAVENAPGDEEWRQIDSSGFNSIRLPIAWANLEPEPPTLRGRAVEHHWNEDYLRALDGIVEACQRHHLRTDRVQVLQQGF